MNASIIVTVKIELINIFVVYKAPEKPVEYPTESEFNESLKSKPLSSIAYIFIPFDLKEIGSLNLVIWYYENINKWVVKRGSHSYFDFSYDEHEGFLDKFWKEFKKRIAFTDHPGPTSELML